MSVSVKSSFSELDLAALRSTAKLSRSFSRLVAQAKVEHEFKGQYGHPSSYAYVRFDCIPSDELSFDVAIGWPETVPSDYSTLLERSIAEGIADVLLDGVYPHRGCRITLVEARYDDIGSSEAAFYKAATVAARKLLEHAWTIV